MDRLVGQDDAENSGGSGSPQGPRRTGLYVIVGIVVLAAIAMYLNYG